MTEKRFVIPNQMRVIRDTVTGEEAIFYDTEDGLLLKEWLNALHEENEQLKQQLKTKVIVNRQYEELQRVKKENEQLKGEVAHYKLILMSLEEQAKRMSSIRRNKND